MGIRPYMIGIAGASCSGKTTLAGRVAERLRAFDPTVLSLDAYYRDLSHMEPEERARQNFDWPGALDRGLLEAHLRALGKGEGVAVPEYDFCTHTRSGSSRWVDPTAVMIVEGLFPLYWAEIRSFFFSRVFVTAHWTVCMSRRINRDVQERGRTAKSVIAQYNQTVYPMSRKFVLPTRRYADLVVSGEGDLDRAASAIVDHVRRSADRPWRRLIQVF